MLPVGTSSWNTPDKISCIGLPLAPTTTSMPARSRSNALLIWWLTSSKNVMDASPRLSSSKLSAAASGLDHR